MTYPLLPYSQLVFDMLKTNPDVYTYRIKARIRKDEADILRIHNAILAALKNHPVFQTVVDEQGMQHFDAAIDPMHGQHLSIQIMEDNTYLYITYSLNRILGDALSEIIVFEDFVRAYNGLSLQPDNYLAYLQHLEDLKQTDRYKSSKQWLEKQFGNLSCPVHPQTDFPLFNLDAAIEGIFADDYSDLREALNHLAREKLISLTACFSLASALAIMEYNDTDEAALTWAYDGRETKEEQRIYGSLHRDIPFKISRLPKEDMLKETRKQCREGIAHSVYPFTLTKPHSDIWNYAVNVLIQPDIEEAAAMMPFAVEVLAPDTQTNYAYSLLDVEIYNGADLTIIYRYSATHYKEESIRKFAALVKKYAEWLIND